MNKAGVMTKLTLIFFIIVFSSIAHAQQAMVVNLQVNDSETKLTVKTPGNCTRSANHPGCVRGQGRQPINFTLGNKSCSSGGNWALSHVALGMSQGSTGNLAAPVVPGDFNADASSGRITPQNQSPSHILVRNNNTASYDVWYTVYATCGNSVIDSDPRVENDGSGRQ